MERSQLYKGYMITASSPRLGFYKSGRGGKVVRKFWVEPEIGGFGVVGKWCNSLAEAKRWVNEQTKGT